MKKLLLALLICGFISSSCKKDDKTFCYKCTVSGGNDSSVEMCSLTEAEGKELQDELNSDSGEETWTCSKK